MIFSRFLFFTAFLLVINSALIFAQYDTITVKYPDGTTQSVITYFKNYREGPAKFFTPDGILIEERNYKDGLVHGLVKSYYTNGRLREVFNVSEGRREGPSTLYDTSGQIVSEKFYAQGRLSDPMAPPEESEDEDLILPPGVEESSIVGILQDTTSTVETAANTQPAANVVPVVSEPEIIDENYFYSKTDIAAIPKVGWDSLFASIKPTQRAKDNGIGGVVEIKAKIDRYGDVTETKLIKGIGYGCDDAAEVVITYTKFLPAYKNGVKVNSVLVIPVNFAAEPKTGFFDFFKKLFN